MNKLFAPLIVLSAVVVSSFASTNATPSLETQVVQPAVSPTAAQLVEKFGDKLDHYITALASKAGVAADHFWPIFVKQQMIEGIYTGCSWAIGVLIAISMIIMAMRNIGHVDDRPTAVPKCIVGFACFAVLTLICLISACKIGQEVISKIFNPEYHAVQSLVKMVK